MEKQELEKVITEVDWETLENRISEIISRPVKLEVKVKQAVEYIITFESQELVSFAGVITPAFSSLKIKDFGVRVDPKQGMVTMTVDYRWELKSGGTNGATLMRAFFNMETREWTFRQEGRA